MQTYREKPNWVPQHLLMSLCRIVLFAFILVPCVNAKKALAKENQQKSLKFQKRFRNKPISRTRLKQKKSIPRKKDTFAKKNHSLKLPLTLSGFSFNEGPDNANVASFLLRPTYWFQPSNDFSLRVGAWAFLNTGRIQDRFILPNQSSNLLLREMVASYQPNENFNFQLGSLDMDDLKNPFLFFRRSFPGFDASYSLEKKRWSLGLGGRYTIPTSFSLEFDRNLSEELPTFAIGGIQGHVDISDSITAKAKVDYFQFDNLPTIAAYSSQFHGNQAVGGRGSARFLYEYRGWAQNYNLNVKVDSKWSANLDLLSVDNLGAPENRSRSQALATSVTFENDKFSLTPRASYFYMESDASPAFYSASYLGHANRVGMHYSLKANLKKWGMKVYGDFVQGKLLSESINQNDLQYVEIGVEVPNVLF